MSVQIGNGNKIKNSNIAENINGSSVSNKEKSDEKKRFYDKHPWISGLIISCIVAFVFLFTFWNNIIAWIEGWF